MTVDVDRDGCLDLVAAPLRRYDRPGAEGELLQRYDGPVRLLRNHCRAGGRWLGLRVDPQRVALAWLALEGPDGVSSRAWRATKPASSVGGVSDPGALHFGLATGAIVVAGAVRCLDGAEVALDDAALVTGAWHDLLGACETGR